VMSSSTVTYTSVYTDSEPGRPVALPSPDYLPRPEHPPSPGYMPGPEHLPSPVDVPYPLPTDASPTALSPGYVADFDPDEDPEEDPEEDHTDYPADGRDGDDEPSDDDDDDDDTDDEDGEPFEDEDDDEEVRETVRLEPPMSASMEACIAKHAATPTLPLPVASPPLPLPSSLTTSPTDAGAPLGYRAVGIRMRAASPPLLLPSTSYRNDIPKAEMPPRKRVCLTTPAPGLEIGESSAAGDVRQPGTTLEADLRRDKVMETGYGI
ncbi:hypothetical protein Tco_1160888, partial [Tanacetum coccineum]